MHNVVLRNSRLNVGLRRCSNVHLAYAVCRNCHEDAFQFKTREHRNARIMPVVVPKAVGWFWADRLSFYC